MKSMKEIVEIQENSRKETARMHFDTYLEDSTNRDALYQALKYAMKAHLDSQEGKKIADFLGV